MHIRRREEIDRIEFIRERKKERKEKKKKKIERNADDAVNEGRAIKRSAISKEIGGYGSGKSFLECEEWRGSNRIESYIVNGYMRRRRNTVGPRTVIVTRLRERFRSTRRRRLAGREAAPSCRSSFLHCRPFLVPGDSLESVCVYRLVGSRRRGATRIEINRASSSPSLPTLARRSPRRIVDRRTEPAENLFHGAPTRETRLVFEPTNYFPVGQVSRRGCKTATTSRNRRDTRCRPVNFRAS